MAERARGRKKAGQGKVPSRGRVATLPKQSKKKRGIGDNSGLHAVSDEVIERHLLTLKAKKKALDKIVADYKEDLDQARGVYRSARKLAKKEGVNLKGFDIMVGVEGQDMGHVQVDYADAGRYLRITDSPLAKQLNLFQNMEAPEPPINALLQGEQAGKNAEPAENNPHTPGSEYFQQWADGWAKGQKANMDSMAGASVN